MNASPFTIYNASAGSGKTFTLVKNYLKTVLQTKNPLLFRQILALTFTNKAVNEMKSRIIDTLQEFSDASILKETHPMFSTISKELGIEKQELHLRSKQLLKNILHNYASFDVSTIDKFNHRLIRTFAFDLKLPVNFEVELDQESLLNEAVDSLIQKTGTDKALTKVLVEFALEKADDDKSWNIALDFNKIAKLLVNENNLSYVAGLADKTLEDFESLKTQLKKDLTHTESLVVETANTSLDLISEAGLEHKDFLRGSLPKYFIKLSKKEFNIDYTKAAWMQKLETEPLYSKSLEASIASTIDAIQPELIQSFQHTKQLVYQLRFLKSFYKNITPLSVLNEINKALNELKLEQNKLLISEFNSLISNEIKDQPTPYIYERLGEKFKHYFIDEFQDTSKMQWQKFTTFNCQCFRTRTTRKNRIFTTCW